MTTDAAHIDMQEALDVLERADLQLVAKPNTPDTPNTPALPHTPGASWHVQLRRCGDDEPKLSAPSLVLRVDDGGAHLKQQVGLGYERELTFGTLSSAAAMAHDILHSFQQEVRCDDCGRMACSSFGEHVHDHFLTWWQGFACKHCGAGWEADGGEMLPPDLREIELFRRGAWGLVIEGAKPVAVMVVARRALGMSLTEAKELRASLPGPVLEGTFAETLRIARVFAEASIPSQVVYTSTR